MSKPTASTPLVVPAAAAPPAAAAAPAAAPPAAPAAPSLAAAAAAPATAALDADELCAVQFLARGFRAGVALRPLFLAGEELHGCAGWLRPAAQSALLDATVSYVPERAPPNFSFGYARAAAFARALQREVDALGARSAPCAALVSLCVAAATAPAAAVATAAARDAHRGHIALHVPCDARGESREVVLRRSTRMSDVGFRLWEAGCVQYLSVLLMPLLRADVAGRRVLELGSGLGLCATALRAAGAARAVLSDVSPDVVANLRANCAPAMTGDPDDGVVCFERVDVRDLRRVAEIASLHAVDTVLAADMSYDPALAAAAVRAIEEVLCACNGARRKVGYLFATWRSEATDRALQSAFAHAAVDVEDVPLAVDADAVKSSSFGIMLHCDKSWNFCNVRLYRLT